MNIQLVEGLVQAIRALSPAERRFLGEQLGWQVPHHESQSLAAIDREMAEMADDPEIQAEIATINQEFAVAELDGLDQE